MASSIQAYSLTLTAIPIDLTATRVYLRTDADVRVGTTAISTDDGGDFFIIPADSSTPGILDVMNPGNRLYVRAVAGAATLRVWEVGV